MTRGSRPRGVRQVALVSAAALAFMTASCTTETENQAQAQPDIQETVQCVDENNRVVDDDMCDDDGDGHGGGGFFVFMSGHSSYPRGTYLDPAQHSRPRVSYKDTAGRSAAGLAPSGKVQTGQRTIANAGAGKGATSGGQGGGKSGGS